jgi:hypothetical protein
MRRGKQLLSIVMGMTLMVNAIPFFSCEKKVEAAQTVTEGVYIIESAYNGKAITQTDMSNYYANCVVWNQNSLSDFARFEVKKSGEYYTITNVVSNKTMKICGHNNADTVDFNGNDGQDIYKWKLVPITGGTYDGCYHIVSAVKNDDGNEEYAEIISDDDKRDKDGAQVRLWTKAQIGEEPRQIWRLVPTSVQYKGFTEQMRDETLTAFRNQFRVYNENTGKYGLKTDDQFWGEAEMMEALLDGYETTGRAIYKDMFVELTEDFLQYTGHVMPPQFGYSTTDDWAWKDWNDDIAWGVIALARGYQLVGTQKYLDIAKYNFDMMYARAHTRSDGMMVWKMNHPNDDTTSCINGPTIIAACYLAQATGDDSYYTKARDLYSAWRNCTLYEREGDEKGHVWDTMWEYWCSTYNQGTFIGSALMLYDRYGDAQYYQDAVDAANHTMKELCYNKVLIKEDNITNDNSKFRGILMRYLRKLVLDYNNTDYISFFEKNAMVAYMNKNSSNIMWNTWNKKTADEVTWYSHASYGAISLMANMPTYRDSLVRNAYEKIEAEDMDYTCKLIAENSSNTSGGASLGGVKKGSFTGYYNVNFGDTGCKEVKLRYSRKTESEGAKGTVQFRLGSATGRVFATAYIDNTGDWSNWTEVSTQAENVTGMQKVFVTFSADTEHVCNLDYFEFVEEEAKKPEVVGFQISTANEGVRVVAAVEPKIGGKNVSGFGLIYGLDTYGEYANLVSDSDMVIDNNSDDVFVFESTPKGISSSVLGESDTATYYIQTMKFSTHSAKEMSAIYKVRPYAILEDGEVVYGDSIDSYSAFGIAKYLYNNTLMNTESAHDYLYNNILTIVDSTFKKKEYGWGPIALD